jgi:hypothetical protein
LLLLCFACFACLERATCAQHHNACTTMIGRLAERKISVYIKHTNVVHVPCKVVIFAACKHMFAACKGATTRQQRLHARSTCAQRELRFEFGHVLSQVLCCTVSYDVKYVARVRCAMTDGCDLHGRQAITAESLCSRGRCDCTWPVSSDRQSIAMSRSFKSQLPPFDGVVVFV